MVSDSRYGSRHGPRGRRNFHVEHISFSDRAICGATAAAGELSENYSCFGGCSFAEQVRTVLSLGRHAALGSAVGVRVGVKRSSFIGYETVRINVLDNGTAQARSGVSGAQTMIPEC